MISSVSISIRSKNAWLIRRRSEVFDSIEVFYNRERRHSALGQLSPAEYERIHQPVIGEAQAA